MPDLDSQKSRKLRSVEPGDKKGTYRSSPDPAEERFSGPVPKRSNRNKDAEPIMAKRPEVSIDYKNSQQKTRVVDHIPLDAGFLMLVIILLLFGLVMVFSASYAQSMDQFGDATHYFKGQLNYAVIGVIAMILFVLLPDYYLLKKLTPLLMIGSCLLLLMVPLFGVEVNGARRWLMIGSVQFQPSEICKVTVIFVMARWCENHRSRMDKILVAAIGYFLAVGPYVPLLMMQPHYSCLILVVATGFVLLYVGGMKEQFFWILMGIGLIAVALFILFGENFPVEYVRKRWHAWKNPADVAQGTGYQIRQSLMALSSGGFFGVGLGNSRQKQLFLPESHNDYILSVAGEELGLLGVLMILLLFALLIWRGVVIAAKARDRFGFLIVVGIMSKIALQVLLNLAVVTNAVPVTGMALPFFSYGGTALVIQLCEMGVVLNVSRQAKTIETKPSKVNKA